MKNLSYAPAGFTNLLRKAAGFGVSAALIGLALLFSALLFVVILTVATMTWGYLWWRTRDLKMQMRKLPSIDQGGGGEVIEGEVIRVTDRRDQP